MKFLIFFALAVSIFLGAMGQIFMKVAMNSIGSFPFAEKEKWFDFFLSILLSKYIWFVFLFYGVSVLLWLIVLSYEDLSLVRPFMSLGYLITLGYGMIAGEQVNFERVLGTLLIVVGVFFLTKS
ncbi:MAG: hypothetical protein ACK4UJ_11325 [Leptonema sp. (in: bacteria)]